MTIATKRSLSRDEVAALVDEDVASVAEIADGSYNTAFRVALVGGDEVVVKVAPPPAVPILTYEHDIMRTEALFYELAAAETAAPLPTVRRADFSRTRIDGDYLVLSVVPGREWKSAPLDDGDRRRLRHDLGGVVAELHRITGQGFGYPQRPLRPTWREAFVAMVEALLDDAARFAVELTPGPHAIREAVEANSHWLDDVDTPALVHFDLWDGNLFVAGDEPQLSGIIDGERAFWGDPHADFVSLALFRDVEDDADLLAGYTAAGGQLDVGPSFRRRMSLYRAYLYLIMVIEGVPRGYGPEWHDGLRRLAAGMLDHELRRLAAPLPA